MDATVVVGIDIGGTGVRAAAVGASGEPGPVARVALGDRTPETVIAAVRGLVDRFPGAERVGVGVPGFVADGVVLGSPNFPSWTDIPLRSRLEEALGLPVAVENDANCAALGAWAARGSRGDLVLVTLGTGVGGGVISDGHLLRGAGGTGAEIGHLYAGGDQPCGCGGIGCLETWCGTTGLVARAAARGHAVSDGAAVFATPEPWARALVEEAADALGRGLVTLVNLFNPDVVVIVGGIAAARDALAPRAEGWLRRHGIAPSVRRARIEWGGTADLLAIAGAAAAARALRGAVTMAPR